MSVSIPIKIYEVLEDKLGRDEAKEIVREIESAVDTVAFQKKIEVKDELTKELVTKAEFRVEIKSLKELFESRIALSETKFESRIALSESKIRLYFLIMLFTMILLNPPAIDIIAKLLGIIK